jgi:hypothetical protein
LGEEKALEKMLLESIEYNNPDNYRFKIPGYKKEINLL